MFLSIKSLILFICICFCRQVETVLVICMVIISEGLVNIDAKILSNTDRYDGFNKNAKHCFLL